MAQVLVPGVAQAVMSGTHGVQPWAVVTHWKYDNQTAPWTLQAIQQLADTLSSSWATHAVPLTAPQVTLTNVNTVDIGTPTPQVGANVTAHVGTGPAAIASSAVCAVISMHVPARYRGGHPRMYMPWGGGTNTLSESQWNTIFISSASAAAAAIASDVHTAIPPIGGSSVSQVCPRYTYQYNDDQQHHKYTKTRIGLKSVDVVQTWQCQQTFGNQRRRLTQG